MLEPEPASSLRFALDHFRLFQPRNVLPGITKEFGKNQFRMLAELGRRSLGVRRRLAQAYGRATDFRLSLPWMIIVYDILVGDHLRVAGQVRYAVDHGTPP